MNLKAIPDSSPGQVGSTISQFSFGVWGSRCYSSVSSEDVNYCKVIKAPSRFRTVPHVFHTSQLYRLLSNLTLMGREKK